MKTTYAVLLLILIGLLMTGCNIKSFEMPSWDVNLNVPLLNKTFYVRDLVDNEYFYLDDNNGIYVQSDGTFETNPLNAIQVIMMDDAHTLPLHSGADVTGTLPLSALQDSIRVAYGVIHSGNLHYNFSSMAAGTTASFTMPELKSAAGIPLTINYTGITGEQSFNLAGYRVGTPGSTTLLTALSYELQVTSSLPGGTPVGNLVVEMDDYIGFDNLRGKVTSYRIHMGQSDAQVDLEYPHGMDEAISVEEATLLVTVYNPFTFECEMHGDIYGTNEDTGKQITISISPNNPYIINAAPVLGTPGVTHLVIHTNIDSLLNVMPTRVELRSAYFKVYNPNNIIGDLNTTDKVTGDYTIQTPLTFSFLEASIVPTDSVEVEIDSDNQETIRDNVDSASMTASVQNELPIGATITMFFSTDPNFDPNVPGSYQISKSAHITARPAAPAANPAQNLNLNLSHDEVLYFANLQAANNDDNPKCYMRMRATFDPSDTVTIHASDYLQLSCMISINATVEDSSK